MARKALFNRRTFQRTSCPATVHYSIKDGPPLDGPMRNIGGGGVCFRAMAFLPVDSILKIEFSLPPLHETFFTIGRVVWANELPHISQHEVGVQFTEISEYDQKRIDGFVERTLEDQTV